MNDLSRLADMAEILGALVVIGGLIFAMLQMRNIRQQRRELAAIELFRFFANPEFNRAYEQILKLPNGLSTADIEARHAGMEHCAMLIMNSLTLDSNCLRSLLDCSTSRSFLMSRSR